MNEPLHIPNISTCPRCGNDFDEDEMVTLDTDEEVCVHCFDDDADTLSLNLPLHDPTLTP